jgi:hypothetical protein
MFIMLLGSDVLRIEYWDADSSTWLSWEVFPKNQYKCSNMIRFLYTCQRIPLRVVQLNIAGFTATQLSGFRYRLAFYDDGPGGGAGFEWGFCFDSPTLTIRNATNMPSRYRILP